MPALHRRVACLLLLASAACASAPSAGSTADGATARASAPKRRSTLAHPELTFPRGSTGELRVDIAVMVDPNGTPDMSTLKLTGNVLSDNREAVARWISQSTFDPAVANGVPVRAEYRTSIRAKTVIRQM